MQWMTVYVGILEGNHLIKQSQGSVLTPLVMIICSLLCFTDLLDRGSFKNEYFRKIQSVLVLQVEAELDTSLNKMVWILLASVCLENWDKVKTEQIFFCLSLCIFYKNQSGT